MVAQTAAAFWFPVLYIFGIGCLFAAYTRYNRAKQRSQQIAQSHDDGYFPAHTTRSQYNELAEMFSPEDPNGMKILMAGLIKRAVIDVQRAFQIREEKPPLQQLVNKGTVGEDLLDKLVHAEQELDAEINEVMEEAELYRTGWGKSIFQEASQLMQLQMQQEAQLAQAAQRADNPNAVAQPSHSHHGHSHDHGHDHDHHGHSHSDENTTPTTSTESLSPTAETEEQRRQRLEAELLAEEEKEKKKGGKGAGGGKGANAGQGGKGKGKKKGK